MFVDLISKLNEVLHIQSIINKCILARGVPRLFKMRGGEGAWGRMAVFTYPRAKCHFGQEVGARGGAGF